MTIFSKWSAASGIKGGYYKGYRDRQSRMQ
jgi:hypothetical protein